jgi:hypothetical protein
MNALELANAYAYAYGRSTACGGAKPQTPDCQLLSFGTLSGSIAYMGTELTLSQVV